MTVYARVEYVHIGQGRLYQNQIRVVIDVPAEVTVTGTATSGGSRPVVPAGETNKQIYAQVTAIGGQVVVAWGSNPTAAQASNGLLLLAGERRQFAVNAGDKLSFITPSYP